MNHKTYTINGKAVIHRPLSPMQLIRLAAIIAELQDFVKKTGTVAAGFNLRNDDSVDMSLIYQVLQELESKKPDLIIRLVNTVFIDAATDMPCYLNDRLTLKDFYDIDPTTFLEVVADFFTLNDVSKTSSMISDLTRKMMNSTNASPTPSASATSDPEASANG